MYTREIQPPIANPVQDGKPVQGTWTRPFERVNLIDSENPFSLPVPQWVKNFRIKEWQSCIAQNDNVIFESLVANMKFFRFIENAFFDKKTGDSRCYQDFFPVARWELPQSLRDSSVECWAFGYSISIRNRLDEANIKFAFEANSLEDFPGMETEFELSLDPKKRVPLVTNLLFSQDRSIAVYKNLGEVFGTLRVGESNRYLFERETSLGLFRDCKAFYPYRTNSRWAHGFGIQKDGMTVAFSLSENRAKSPNKDNENVLWTNGTLTALPPVRITHSEGTDKNWVIEDVEGMVDLCFTPKKKTEGKGFNLLFSRLDFHNPFGVFNGMVMGKDGCQIEIHNLWGCAESLYMRL